MTELGDCLKVRSMQSLILISFMLFFAHPVFSLEEDNRGNVLRKSDTIEIKSDRKEAIEQRKLGLKEQEKGNLAEAMLLYNKAVEFDPTYAQVYCDIGVIYEAYRIPAEAEKAYLTAINVDQNCLSAYSNLAALYEANNVLDRAIYYWQERASRGKPGDKWTKTAKEKVAELSEIISKGAQGVKLSSDKDQDKQVPISLPQEDKAKENRQQAVAQVYTQKQESAPTVQSGDEVQDKNQEIISLKQRLVALSQERDEQLAAKENELNAKQTELISLRQDLERINQQKENLIAGKDTQLNSKEQEVLALKQQIALLNDKQEYNKDLETGQLSLKEKELEYLKKEIELLKQDKENLLSQRNNELQAKSQEFSSGQSQLEALKKEFESWKTKTQQEIQDKNKELNARMEELISLKQKLAEVDRLKQQGPSLEELDFKDKQIQNLKQELTQKDSQLKSKMDELLALKQKVYNETNNQDSSLLSEQISVKDREIELLKQELSYKNQELNSRFDELIQIRTKLAEFNQEKNKELARKSEECAAKDKELEDARQQVTSLSAQKESSTINTEELVNDKVQRLDYLLSSLEQDLSYLLKNREQEY